MKMLDEIVAAAVDDKVPVATVLRRGLVLASALRNDKLKAWLLDELNGYPDDKPLPDYRTAYIGAVGLFVGYAGSTINDQPLNAAVLDERDREWATTASFRGGVASYENPATDPAVKSVQVHWPAYLIARYQTSFMQNESWVLNRAHQVIPRACLVNLVECVRNRVLEFALEIRNEVGSSDPTPNTPSPADVEKYVTNIIYGGTNVFGGSIGGDVIHGANQTIVKGDFATLSGALKQIGFPDASIGELKAALAADAAAGHKTDIGPRADGWLKTTIKALGRGTLKVGTDVATKVATAAVLTFLGVSAAR